MLTIATLFTGVLLGYSTIEDEKLIEYRFGVILTVLMLALIGSPLFSLVNLSSTELILVYFLKKKNKYDFC